jgi:hypothetical protein
MQGCSHGQLSACACNSRPSGPPQCGDGACNGDETCTSCAEDCGACAACSGSPSCSDALGVPTAPLHRYDLDVNAAATPDMYTTPMSTASDCGPAQLRLRIASITATKGGGELYCIISASDGGHSEVAITTKTKSLNDGETSFFDPSVGVTWGQKALQKTSDNLTLTYDCFKVGSDAWAQALMALGNSAQQAGGIAGPYGWAFGIGAAAAAAAAAAAQAASGDDHRFNMQQTIDRKTLIDLTNGRTWSVRASGGCGLFCSWDWTIALESWGCASAKAPPPI